MFFSDSKTISKANTSEQIKRTFLIEELSSDSTDRKSRTVQKEGKRIAYFDRTPNTKRQTTNN